MGATCDAGNVKSRQSCWMWRLVIISPTFRRNVLPLSSGYLLTFGSYIQNTPYHLSQHSKLGSHCRTNDTSHSLLLLHPQFRGNLCPFLRASLRHVVRSSMVGNRTTQTSSCTKYSNGQVQCCEIWWYGGPFHMSITLNTLTLGLPFSCSISSRGLSLF